MKKLSWVLFLALLACVSVGCSANMGSGGIADPNFGADAIRVTSSIAQILVNDLKNSGQSKGFDTWYKLDLQEKNGETYLVGKTDYLISCQYPIWKTLSGTPSCIVTWSYSWPNLAGDWTEASNGCFSVTVHEP